MSNTVSEAVRNEIQKRRTFAIISHPDAGKTTLTEKLLLYGGAIVEAGMVKGKKNMRHAVSDWMEIEKQRGISVTSSVMQFRYEGFCINILDTPGHQDFSEDTYRTLMAADSAVMVIDGSKGVEAQTRKLFKVCRMRGIPIFTFINKMDREAKDSFELMSDIEGELGIEICPINWPIGSGKNFQGVYDRQKKVLLKFTAMDELGNETATGSALSGAHAVEQIAMDLSDPSLSSLIGDDAKEQLIEELDLLDGAGHPLDMDMVQRGELSPVFFGSALTNFGVQPFLESFLQMTSTPLPRRSEEGLVEPVTDSFSGFVFKIQANMNKAHRDRVAFLRICSGVFEKGMEVYHVQEGKKIKISQPTQLMAQDRSIVDVAYAGDIISIFDPGIFSIGDTICDPKNIVHYQGIPTFAPEHFARLRQIDSLKRKQFIKGTTEIAQEGAIQIFMEPGKGMEEVIVGVVGTLQFDVLTYRLEHEYNIATRLEMLPYEHIRWVENKDINPSDLTLTSDTKIVQDMKGNHLLLFASEWNIDWALSHNKGLELSEFNEN